MGDRGDEQFVGPVARCRVRNRPATVCGEPTNCVATRSATSSRSASVHSWANASSTLGNGIAPRPVRMLCTHRPYGVASRWAAASSSATTTSADTMTCGASRIADGRNASR